MSYESGIVPGSFLLGATLSGRCVVFDIVSQFLFEVLHALERVRVEKFGLHYPEEVLHHGVIQAVSFAAHALGDSMIFQ